MELLLPLGLLLLGYFVGTQLERKHFADLRAREQALVGFVTSTLRTPPVRRHVQQAELVSGSAVISLDYFKRFVASLKSLVGGRLTTYEPLLDRGRREAMLRMREQAKAGGFDAVIRVRYETSSLATTQGKEGIGGVEMLVYGTAIRFADRPQQRLPDGSPASDISV